MSVVARIKEAASKAISHLYSFPITAAVIAVNQTKPEFEGDYTIVLFSLIKQLKKSPEAAGKEIGDYLLQHNHQLFTSYNVIKGFLNLTLSDVYFMQFLSGDVEIEAPDQKHKIVVEYSSPNTNKPLHLGHLRNNFLGWSIAEILKANGHEVAKTCVVNDRGIHICKSMIAWELFSDGATPESTGIKGDHLVGDYYVQFSNELKKEVGGLVAQGVQKEEAEKKAPIMQKTQQMLLDWEEGKPEVIRLWRKMNSWVYKGFDETYKRIGTDFDKIYYESETYLLGKQYVEKGLESGVFYKKEDGSVWIDLTAEGMDEKLVLRKDGTSVYITQDLGLAEEKYNDYHYDQSIYVIADEQNYHMNVLKAILQRLGKPYANGIQHLSYGMVELPTGRMKSREGTVVDADDLLDEMVKEAERKTKEHSKIEDFSAEELESLYEMIGVGALKYFLLRVDPKKKMVFNPEESIEFYGFTGPFIQYTHARIKSVMRKAGMQDVGAINATLPLLPLEKNVILLVEQYATVVQQAALEQNPSLIAIHIFNIAKAFNTFYTEHSVMNAETPEKKSLRLALCNITAGAIKRGMQLLGIQVPEKM